MTGTKACATGEDRAYVGAPPTLRAALYDPEEDNQPAEANMVKGEFEAWWTDADGVEQRLTYTTNPTLSGARQLWRMPQDGIPANTVVSWHVRANDGTENSLELRRRGLRLRVRLRRREPREGDDHLSRVPAGRALGGRSGRVRPLHHGLALGRRRGLHVRLHRRPVRDRSAGAARWERDRALPAVAFGAGQADRPRHRPLRTQQRRVVVQLLRAVRPRPGRPLAAGRRGGSHQCGSRDGHGSACRVRRDLRRTGPRAHRPDLHGPPGRQQPWLPHPGRAGWSPTRARASR